MDDTVPGRQMPRYRCHKEVWALWIEDVRMLSDGKIMLQPADRSYAPLLPLDDWQKRTKAMLESKGMSFTDLKGGYYVVYAGGYTSWSPKDEFEQGYSLITR